MRCRTFSSQEPMKIIELLRLWEQGFNQREIATSVNCSKTTVAELQRKCTELELTYQTAKGMSDETINRLVYPSCHGGRPLKKDPDWEAIQKRLDSNKRMNLQYLWEEYRETEKDGLSRS